jgi:hypothetical protein
LEDEADEEVDDPDVESCEKDDEDEIDPSVEASDDAMVDEVAAEADDAELPALTRAEVNLGRFAITKVQRIGMSLDVITHFVHSQLRNLAKRIVNSPTIRPDLETACAKTDTKPALMVRDVATRWNSTSELLERALHLRRALNLLVGYEQHNKPRSARLQRFKLSVSEWELLEQLWPLLDVRVHVSHLYYGTNMFVTRHFYAPQR